MRILVIGIGYWGSKLLDRFIDLEGLDNVVVTDIEMEKSAEAMVAKRVSAAGIGQLGHPSSWPMVDACVIATPIDTHYELVKMCLLAGKHVLVEKPMAKTGSQARELADIAEQNKLVLMTDLTFLYNYSLPEDAMGALVELSWRGPPSGRSSENILWTWGPHPISLMLAINGRPDLVQTAARKDLVQAVYGYKWGHTTINLEWGPSLARQRKVVLKGGEVVDLGAPVNPEPLREVCKEFVRRVASPLFNDHLGVETVELLERTEAESRT